MLSKHQFISPIRVVRKLSGGSLALRVVCDNDKTYALKLKFNPQSNRCLINEWIATTLFAAIGLPVPRISLAKLSNDFLAANSEVGSSKSNLASWSREGFHLGIAYPVDPNKATIHDIIPDSQAGSVVNRSDFLKVRVADRWLANLDTRQAVFVRARQIDPKMLCNADALIQHSFGLAAVFIDQGFCFNSNSWNFETAPGHGLYPASWAYDSDDWRATPEIIEKIEDLRSDQIHEIFDSVPEEWCATGDREQLERLCRLTIHKATMLHRLPDFESVATRRRPASSVGFEGRSRSAIA